MFPTTKLSLICDLQNIQGCYFSPGTKSRAVVQAKHLLELSETFLPESYALTKAGLVELQQKSLSH